MLRLQKKQPQLQWQQRITNRPTTISSTGKRHASKCVLVVGLLLMLLVLLRPTTNSTTWTEPLLGEVVMAQQESAPQQQHTTTAYSLASSDIAKSKLAGENLPQECDIKMIGGTPSNNDYGAWPVCKNYLPANPIVYSFGIGGDVSFDTAVAEDYNATVFCYDPTIGPDRFKNLVGSFSKPDELHFLQFGLAFQNGVIPFYKAKNPKIGSLSSTRHEDYESSPYMMAPVMDFDSFRRINDHDWVDVVKCDIETAEFDLFLHMDLENVRATQFLIEFHARLYHEGWKLQEKIYERFKESGWQMKHESERKEEVVFVRQSSLRW